MEAFRTRGTAVDGKLIVGVPREFEKMDLEIIVLKSDSTVEDKNKNAQERQARLLKIAGSAKFPDFSIDKYDVYDQ